MKALCPEAADNLEFVQADLNDAESWQETLKDGIKDVYHVASPFPMESPADEMELIRPAVDGTLNVLKACKDAKVRRVVLTSSVAAINDLKPHTEPIDESIWVVEKECYPYQKSKLLAEKAAWDFVEKLDESDKFELVVMNPSFVMGPVFYPNSGTSIAMSKKLLERDMAALPRLQFHVVDVRDVAEAHIKGMEMDDAVGKRHLLLGSSLWFSEIAKIMADEMNPMGYAVPTRELPDFVVKFLSYFVKSLSFCLPRLGLAQKFNTSRMTDVLGVKPRPIKETLLDLSYNFVDLGIVHKTGKYKPRSVE